MAQQQPHFWLEVKKEYVIENFEQLFKYLWDYIYIKVQEHPDGDYEKSFNCLKEVVDDLLADYEKTCLYKDVSTIWQENTLRNIRIIATYLLAAKKMDIYDNSTLVKFADMLLVLDNGKTSELAADAARLINSCYRGEKVRNYGFSWSEIANEDSFLLTIFSMNVMRTTFEPAQNPVPGYFEGKGLFVVKPDGYSILPMNKNQYLRAGTTLQTQIQLPLNGKIEVAPNDLAQNRNIEELLQLKTDLLLTQNNVKPSPVVHKMTYSLEDELYVKVIACGTTMLTVESIDPKYEKLTGNVYVPSKNQANLTRLSILKELRQDDILKVKYRMSGTCIFSLEDTLHDFFEDEMKNVGGDVDAIYHGEYSVGYQWLGDNGMIINVLNKDVDENIDYAIGNGNPVRIRIIETKLDKKGHWVINGRYLREPAEKENMTEDEFEEEMRHNLVLDLLDYCYTEIEPNPDDQPLVELSRLTPQVYMHILWFLADKEADTRQRYAILTATLMLAVLSQSDADKPFIEHEVGFQNYLIAFAQGETARSSAITADESIKDNSRVMREDSIVNSLSQYDDAIADTPEHRSASRDIDLESLQKIIGASNVLNGRIDISEMNHIKKSIASQLRVGDVYKNIYRNLTYYGDESDTLEFKESLVYPSGNGMQPNLDVQKWNVLTPICGFFNTVSGGELLLGVNDKGYSSGLANDLEYLYNHHLIDSQSMDKYRLYVKYMIDHAFRDDNGDASGLDITATRVSLIIEKNNEGDDILRIQVRPYEFGIVSFADNEQRPAGIADSYYRSSGATVPMNSEVKRQAMEKKLSTASDANVQKTMKLKQAIRNRLCVDLVGYTSDSGKRTRHVEPYQLLPTHKAVVCYDNDKRKIKEFKISRADDVVVTAEKWKNAGKHKELKVDIFDMLQDSGSEPVQIVMKLKPLAYNLLKEEHPMAGRDLKPNNGLDKEEYPWILNTEIYNMKGIGRFYVGLLQDIKLVTGNGLNEYIREYLSSSSTFRGTVG